MSFIDKLKMVLKKGQEVHEGCDCDHEEMRQNTCCDGDCQCEDGACVCKVESKK